MLETFQFFIHQMRSGYGFYLAGLPGFPAPEYNGVQIKLSHFPWQDVDNPTYESGLIKGINDKVCSGDTVVIVGGGKGITAVKAAKRVGEQGRVIVFEGSESQVRKTRQTIQFNGVNEIVEVHHRVVGAAVGVYGDQESFDPLPPSDLPGCDVLELDCEGAEIEILENLEQRPRTILVETHGMHNAPPDRIRSLLENLSYEVVSKGVADDSKSEFCIKNGIMVLTAIGQNPE
ncbi:hypothetical protein [Natrinema sp. H-ect4]|uniref:hypothetical protein n=1 Tax=Natrinema sp. H-ect4 TaxID=3242699 RepID=UPI0035A93DA5